MKKKRLIGGLLVAGMTLASGIVIGMANTKAVDFSSTDSYVSVGEIWNDDTKSFNQDNMRILMKYITGDENATIDDIKTLSATPQKSSVMRTKELSAGVEGSTGYTKKSSTQNINVWLGGLEWQVTYLSQDKSGNPILTLWLSNSTQDAFLGRSAEEGTHYGYVNGNLYSDWSNNWSSGTTASAYPSAMYGTSYVRAVTLNNGGQYALNNTTLSAEYEQSESSAFALFTMDEFGLTDYLVTPANVSWQENQLSKNYGASYNYPNDGWAMNQADTGYYTPEYNYSEKTGYDIWKDDYLWLPSMSETGWTTSSSGGLWGLNVYQRMNYDGETQTNSEKVGTAQGTGYYSTFLRSGYGSTANTAYCLYPSGSYHDSSNVGSSRSIRPSLHLNLSSAVPSTAPREITFESNGGTSVGSKIYYNGQKYLNLPTPTYEGKYFAGWYLDSSLTQPVTGSTVVSLDTTSATLYAKWEDVGYTINYNLNGGNSSVTMPTAVASGGEFNLQSPTRFGYLFKGWSLGEGTDFAIAYTGTEGATALATAGDVIIHPSGGSVYFKNLTQAGGAVTLIANWEVDPNAKEFQVLTYNEYFIDNNITKDTIDIYTISTKSELSNPSSSLYKQYDLVVCGDTYYYVYTTEGFMYLFNSSISGISLANKFVEIECDIYLNDENFDSEGNPTSGDNTIYQYSPPASGKGLTLDGNGHTIHGLYYNNIEKESFAMFYCSGSTVQSIKNFYLANYYVKVARTSSIVAFNVNYIENVHILGGTFSAAGGYASAIAYRVYFKATKCTSEADIRGGRETAGLFRVGVLNAVFEDCTNYGDVSGDWAVGGIFSFISGIKHMTFKNCDNYGTITGTQHSAGLVGIWYNAFNIAEFVDCDNFGKIDGINSNAAGFIGYAEGHFSFSNCRSEGTLVSTSTKGMFIANIVNTNMTELQAYDFADCYAYIDGNNSLIGNASTTNCDARISFSQLKVDYSYNSTMNRYMIVASKTARITVELKDVEINVNCKTYQGYISYGETTMKNILLNVKCQTFSTRNDYQYLSNSTLTSYDGVILNIQGTSSALKSYYGSSFSSFFSSWKTGKIGLKSLSGANFFQNTLTEEILTNKGYTKKEF